MKKIKMSTTKMTFEEGCNKYLEYYRQRNLRQGTIGHYKQSYTQFYKYFDPQMPIEDFDEALYKSYVLHLKATLDNDVSINSYLRDLITTLHFFMNEGYIPHFKMQAIKVDKSGIETYTEDELRALLKKPKYGYLLCLYSFDLQDRQGRLKVLFACSVTVVSLSAFQTISYLRPQNGTNGKGVAKNRRDRTDQSTVDQPKNIRRQIQGAYQAHVVAPKSNHGGKRAHHWQGAVPRIPSDPRGNDCQEAKQDRNEFPRRPFFCFLRKDNVPHRVHRVNGAAHDIPEQEEMNRPQNIRKCLDSNYFSSVVRHEKENGEGKRHKSHDLCRGGKGI